MDLCRFFAAVVLAHLIHFDIAKGDWIRWLPYNGRDAVNSFFLLSGYVIFYTFTLYLIHALVMKIIEHNWQIETEAISTSIFILLLVAFSTWSIGIITEQRKHKFKPVIILVVNFFVKIFNTFPLMVRLIKPSNVKKYEG